MFGKINRLFCHKIRNFAWILLAFAQFFAILNVFGHFYQFCQILCYTMAIFHQT